MQSPAPVLIADIVEAACVCIQLPPPSPPLQLCLVPPSCLPHLDGQQVGLGQLRVEVVQAHVVPKRRGVVADIALWVKAAVAVGLAYLQPLHGNVAHAHGFLCPPVMLGARTASGEGPGTSSNSHRNTSAGASQCMIIKAANHYQESWTGPLPSTTTASTGQAEQCTVPLLQQA